MKRYRTTLDGINYIMVPLPEPPKPKPSEPDPRNYAAKFQQIRAVIEDEKLLEPEDLRD